MQALEAPPRSNARIHLTRFRDLERHWRNQEKHAAYERLLADFGVDLASFGELATPPRLILAEQPGLWLSSDDLMRHRLFLALAETMAFHESSAVLSLASDAFTCRGAKKIFLLFHLFRELDPVPVVGASYVRRYRNRVYRALPISGSTRERIAAIFDVSLAMLGSAAVSPEAFASETHAIFQAGVRSGLRPLLPRRTDRKSLRELGARLREHDLASARTPLAAARRELAETDSWVRYWDRVNERFLGSRIGKLGPLFNRFLLTIEDPLRMSRHLLRLVGHPEGKPIAVAGIVADDEKYRVVYFDPLASRFFYRSKGNVRRGVTWEKVRRLAEEGRTGGPSGTLEYLMMAASGIYMVVDPDDGRNRFESLARKIHRQYTGLPFPCVALLSDGAGPATEYLRIFEPDFEARSRAALDRFFQ